MLNCPGRNRHASPVTGTSDKVVTSPVSTFRPTTRWGTGDIGPGPSAGRWMATRPVESVVDPIVSAGTVCPVQVEEAYPGRLEPLEEHACKPGDQQASEGVIGVGLGAQAGRVDGDGPHRVQGPGVELPPVGREHPAPADGSARADGLDD